MFPAVESIAKFYEQREKARQYRKCRLVPVGKKCSCGNHVAVKLVDRETNGVLAEEICPDEWLTICACAGYGREEWRHWKNEHRTAEYEWDTFVKTLIQDV